MLAVHASTTVAFACTVATRFVGSVGFLVSGPRTRTTTGVLLLLRLPAASKARTWYDRSTSCGWVVRVAVSPLMTVWVSTPLRNTS